MKLKLVMCVMLLCGMAAVPDDVAASAGGSKGGQSSEAGGKGGGSEMSGEQARKAAEKKRAEDMKKAAERLSRLSRGEILKGVFSSPPNAQIVKDMEMVGFRVLDGKIAVNQRNNQFMFTPMLGLSNPEEAMGGKGAVAGFNGLMGALTKTMIDTLIGGLTGNQSNQPFDPSKLLESPFSFIDPFSVIGKLNGTAMTSVRQDFLEVLSSERESRDAVMASPVYREQIAISSRLIEGQNDVTYNRINRDRYAKDIDYRRGVNVAIANLKQMGTIDLNAHLDLNNIPLTIPSTTLQVK